MKVVENDFLNEIYYELRYPAHVVTPRQVAMEHLQLKPHVFDRLHKEGHFEGFMFRGVWFFCNESLYKWAYENKPEVTNFFINFEEKGRKKSA